eukprot:scaffold457271_cov30-Prasinocladus_malaysianus.AAC.1
MDAISKDAVYDLKEALFRDGRPSDYVSLSTGFYRAEVEEVDNEKSSRLMETIRSMTNDDEVERFLIDERALLLGGVREERGETERSSELSDIGVFLGECKRNTNYEFRHAEVRKHPCFEPVSISTTWYATLSSDKFEVRTLYGDPITFKLMGVVNILCNNLHEIPAGETGGNSLGRRYCVIDFPFEFVDNPEPSNPIQKQIDRDLKRTVIEDRLHLAQFVRILIERYKELGGARVSTPKSVLSAAEGYINSQDNLQSFLDKIYTGNMEDSVTANDLFLAFKASIYYSGSGLYNPKRFGTQMGKKRIGKGRSSGNNIYLGLRL